jgi:hypothetical protein
MVRKPEELGKVLQWLFLLDINVRELAVGGGRAL